ncbi:MAG: DUF2807 domain-containing protein [archaeon]
MRSGRSSAFFGVVLVAIGLIFLLRNIGFVDISILEYFAVWWPAGLVLAGIAIMSRQRDAGIAILALTFVLGVIYGIGQIGPINMHGNLWFPGMHCISGSGNATSVTRELVDFRSVSASSGVNVYLSKGAEARARVEADDNIIGSVKTVAAGGKLEIYLDSCVRDARPVNVYVTFQDVDRLTASSAAKVTGESEITADEIELEASSSGDIDVDVDASTVKAGASSAGKITVSGSADLIDATASSSGIVNAMELFSKDAEAEASSAGVVQVRVSEKLKAGASSAGKVQYKGSPKQVERAESSGGVVQEIS